MEITITATIASYPKLPYAEIAKDILGHSYQLSLVFIGETRAATLNKKYRNKTYVPNVLSFPLEKNIGEIFIAPKVAAKEAHKFNMTPAVYTGFLFIHGLLHLKGYRHGATMEVAEKKYTKKYLLK